MDNKTTFQDIKVGDKFIRPGGKTVYVKVDDTHATRGAVRVRVPPGTNVVPEFTATVADILGSWSKL